MTAFPVKKLTLENGLRVILSPQPGLTATALILVEAGSEYETRETNGISHFLEHMVFKGTKSRPHSSMITESLDGLGAHYNAFTTQEATGYWAKARREKLPQLLDLVSDLYVDPILEPAEVEKERGVIIEELNMREDVPTWKSYFSFLEALYGDQPAGWRIGGKKDVIRGITRDQILAYREARYVPAGTIISIAGEFNENEVLAFIEKRFGGMPSSPVIAKSPVAESQSEPNLKITPHRTSDQIHMILGVRTFSVSDERRYAAEILSHVLAGGMSSRLFKKLREDMGATYYVDSDSRTSLDHGYLSISAGVTPSKLLPAVKVILEECSLLAREAVGPAEMRRVKDHLIGTFMLNLEGSESLAEFFADQEIFTRTVLAPEEYSAKLEAVTAEEVRALAAEIFVDRTLNLSLVGETEEAEELRKILHFPG